MGKASCAALLGQVDDHPRRFIMSRGSLLASPAPCAKGQSKGAGQGHGLGWQVKRRRQVHEGIVCPVKVVLPLSVFHPVAELHTSETKGLPKDFRRDVPLPAGRACTGSILVLPLEGHLLHFLVSLLQLVQMGSHIVPRILCRGKGRSHLQPGLAQLAPDKVFLMPLPAIDAEGVPGFPVRTMTGTGVIHFLVLPEGFLSGGGKENFPVAVLPGIFSKLYPPLRVRLYILIPLDKSQLGKTSVVTQSFVGKNQVRGVVGQKLAAGLEARGQLTVRSGKFRQFFVKPMFV